MRELAQPGAGRRESAAERVAAQVAAAYEHLQRSHRRVQSAMAQVRRVDRLLHAGPRPLAAGEMRGGFGLEHLTEVMEQEQAAHGRALATHERAARLQEAAGWPERAAAARAHAAHARELSRRAREELARVKAQAAASRSWVDQAQQRLP